MLNGNQKRNPPIRVLQLGKYFPPKRGGIERIVKDLVESTELLQVQTDVLCFSSSRRTKISKTDHSGAKIIEAGTLFTAFNTPFSFYFLTWLFLLRKVYDVYQLHYPNPFAVLCYLIARPSGKLVLHWHSDVVGKHFARIVFRPFEKLILMLADVIVCTSRQYAESSEALRPFQDKVVVIPIGIREMRSPEPALSKKIREKFSFSFVIFSLGRMVDYKAFDDLISAVAKLPASIGLVLGGDGPNRSNLEALSKSLQIKDRVIFLGEIPENDLPAYFEASDVFVLTSSTRAEAFGIVQLEAMSFGKPVICSAIQGSGVLSILVHGESGFYYPSRAVDELIGQILTLYGNQSLVREMGRCAKKRFSELFTLEKMMMKFRDLYADCIVGTYAKLKR